MKRIIIIIFILAGILDYLSYHGAFDKNKLYIYEIENNEVKEKRYFPKDIQIHIEVECPSYSFYRVRLRDDNNVFLSSNWVSGKNGRPYYQSYRGLEAGNYSIEIIDNFGISQSRSIKITENKTLSYDDIMDMFYPKQQERILKNKLFTKNDTLRFNSTEDNIFCSGYNGMLYQDSLEALTLELFQKSNIRTDEIINVFKLDNDFLLYLHTMEQELELKSENIHPNGDYDIFEFIFNNRKVYYIPVSYSNSFRTDLLDMINEFSYSSSTKEIRRY